MVYERIRGREDGEVLDKPRDLGAVSVAISFAKRTKNVNIIIRSSN
jgi:hypothetical protein